MFVLLVSIQLIWLVGLGHISLNMVVHIFDQLGQRKNLGDYNLGKNLYALDVVKLK